MRQLLFTLVLSVLGNIANCQQYNNATIPVSDFIKGINNFDYLRGILIENGFQLLLNSDSQEKWLVFKKKEENLYAALSNGVLLSVILVTSRRDSLNPFKTIIFKVYYEMSDYNASFLNDIKKNFPDKEVEKIEDNYLLYYSNKNSRNTILFQEGEGYFQYQFY